MVTGTIPELAIALELLQVRMLRQGPSRVLETTRVVVSCKAPKLIDARHIWRIWRT